MSVWMSRLEKNTINVNSFHLIMSNILTSYTTYNTSLCVKELFKKKQNKEHICLKHFW